MDFWITNEKGVDVKAFTPFDMLEKTRYVKYADGRMDEIMSAYLTYEDRLEIEAGLKEHKTFGEIGRQLGKYRTTIAKEIPCK